MKYIVTFLISVFIYLIGYSDYNIERLEPPFWWTGMENTELQLMVYGQDISDLDPRFTYPGVWLKRVVSVQNPNYLFITLEISEDALPGTLKIDFFRNGKSVISHSYTLYEREERSAQRQGFNTSDVIYLITPDRFANGDASNDKIIGYADTLDRSDPQARHGGDIQGIIDRFDYMNEMGFTAIWLNPVLENAMPRTSYHGYATTDFYKIDPRFGTNELYRELGKLCKEKDIKLVMDMIMNHCGSEHWWMKDLPSGDWIHFGGDFVVTNHRRTTVQDPYAAPSEKKLFEEGWFVSAMPDMNQDNPLLAQYLIQNSIWWIEYAHLQGVRHDTHSYPDKEFMSEWSCAIMQEYPDFNIVGEEWSPNPALVAYWQKGKDNPDEYTSCMPSMMDFPTQMTLVESLNDPEAWNKGFIRLYENLANDFLYADPYNLVIFADNHDMSRFYTQVNEDYGLFKMGMAYILTMRGIPQIYYGTENLMSNPGSDAHGVIRSDFPGGWQGDEVNAFTGEGLSELQQEALDYLKTILNWRKTKECIHSGDLIHYNPLNGVYVYFRFNNDEKVMVVMNKNENSAKPDMKRFLELPLDQTNCLDVISGKEYFIDNLEVPARSVLILELN